MSEVSREEADKVVTITMQDGLPVASPDPVPIKRGSQKIKWCADFDFSITVDEYTDIKYSTEGKEFCAKSGKFDRDRKYKYSITANGVTNDPEIDVKP